MKQTAPVKLVRILSWLGAIILLLIPFHAFLTVWLSSLIGHYTGLRLWKEFLLVPIVIGALYVSLSDKALSRRLWSSWLARLITVYSAVILICGLTALASHSVSPKAMWYGILADLRFLVFFMAMMVLAAKDNWLSSQWQRILFTPAILVAAFAILQYLILPYDFLKHFGYGDSTISPYETINHNISHIRVASTLRGANPLGAYLILPISAAAYIWIRLKNQRFNLSMIITGLILALAFSFSRSAWIGTAASLLIIVWYSFKSERLRKNIGWTLAGILLAAAILTYTLRNNLAFENAVFHTDRKSTIAVSSNEGHSAASNQPSRISSASRRAEESVVPDRNRFMMIIRPALPKIIICR